MRAPANLASGIGCIGRVAGVSGICFCNAATSK
jgi:hypothetical protein